MVGGGGGGGSVCDDVIIILLLPGGDSVVTILSLFMLPFIFVPTRVSCFPRERCATVETGLATPPRPGCGD